MEYDEEAKQLKEEDDGAYRAGYEGPGARGR